MKKKSYIYFVLSVSFIFIGLTALSKNIEKDNSKISVVVIDPGHGGKDSGAAVGKALEKDIVLDIALKLGNEIKNNYPDIEVIYTRSKDVFIPLHQRADIANKKDADLFISIHVNAVDAKSVQGTETFVLGLHRNKDNLEVAQMENSVILLEDDYSTRYEGFDPNLPESYIMFETMQEEYQEQSVLFASHIQTQFKQHAMRMDRSVKMAGFLVLRQTSMPSVLIETGFLSHANERNFLISSSGQTKLASAIYEAFVIYKSDIEEKSKFNMITKDIAPTPIPKEPNETQPSTQADLSNTSTKMLNTAENNKSKTADLYFTVQIMALKKRMETTPSNFKGEDTIFRIDDSNISRYFLGKFDTLEEAIAEKDRINSKFENAFVVAFKNKKLISVKKAMEKR
jgi:N-acetylmuramoyl-L-alanine amidase